MAKKILALLLGVVLIMSLAIFAGCGDNKYNAEIFYNVQALMNSEYLNANMTLGAYMQGGQLEDTNSPETRTHIITNKDDLYLAFAEFQLEIDFFNKMLLVHFFTSSYPTSPYVLNKIDLDGDSLHIDFKLNKPNSQGPDTSIPQQTCIMVLMDKFDINTVSFNKK